ncbi:MAG TPA: TRCF domain-containing protein, partial [Ktedonobacterales bacterium]|nr:TRCF domain-containing protein [Ktedonobacterales bacterium]
QAELQDRFGAPLPPVANLLKLIALKVEAGEVGFESISLKEGMVVLKARRNMTPNRVALYRRFRNEVKVQLGVIQIPRRLLPDDPQELVAALHDLLPQISTVGGPQLQPVQAGAAQ